MRVLHIIPYFSPNFGGPPFVVAELCKASAELGITSEIVTSDARFSEKDDTSHFVSAGKIKIHKYKAFLKHRYAFNLGLIYSLNRRLNGYNLVHVHGLWNFPGLLAAFLCKRKAIPYLVMPHGMLDPNSLSRKRLKKTCYLGFVENYVLRHAAGWIFTSEAERDLSAKFLGATQRACILPLAPSLPGEPPYSREKLSDEFPSLKDRRFMLFLSRVDEKKGIFPLLAAFAEVRKQYQSLILAIAGPSDVGTEARVLEKIKEYKLTEAVVMVGPVYGAAKESLLLHSEFFILPSYQENFALALVEAMACGKAVITTKNVHIYKDIVKASAGLVCETNAKSIEDAIVRLMNSPDLQNALGSNGQEFVRRNYSWRKSAEILQKFYSIFGNSNRSES
jgi:glycosyltransferase involved in cell wall biosynthesis